MLPRLLTTFAAIPNPNSCQITPSFFGLVPWYGYLPKTDFSGTGANCTINSSFNVLSSNGTSDIPLILLAVADDLLRVAGLIAVGYIIYAAIQYVTSQGDPEHTARALKTIINALVGLGISLVAIVFVSYLGNSLK